MKKGITKQELGEDVLEDLNKIGNLSTLEKEIIDCLTNENKEINITNAINYLYKNGGSGESGNNDNDGSIKLGTIENLTAISDLEGTKAILSWQNSTITEFQKVEIYVSTQDLTSANYDYCTKNATKIVDSKIDTFEFKASNNTTFYFKAFAVYNIFGTLQYSNGSITSVKVLDTKPPAIVTDIKATAGNGEVTLTWINPKDIDFAKIKIVRKENSKPTDIKDGIVVYEGNNITYKDTSLSNGTNYYYRFFTYDTNNNVNDTDIQIINVTPQAYAVYGVKIDTTNSNPETALNYTDMAIGFIPANGNNGNFQYNSWEDKFPFNEIKPCLYKDGEVNYYLDPNDYTKKTDGNNSDIISGNDGDVMIEFPKIYWKLERIGTDIYIRYSNAKVDDNYKCLAHMKGDVENEKCYISAYLGFEMSSKLRSLSDKIPTTKKSISEFRNLAQANGEKYNQMAYSQLLMLQVLFVVMFKNIDSQTVLGKGLVNNGDTKFNTGKTNNKGLFYGENTGKQQMKFCGIEDLWGNCFYWIDGFYCDSNNNVLIGNKQFNNTGEGYINYGKEISGASEYIVDGKEVMAITGYISDIRGETETGFLSKIASGSTTTYYCDKGNLYPSKLPRFGGNQNISNDGGIFAFACCYNANEGYASDSGRLMAL